jgi:hypothetical protein
MGGDRIGFTMLKRTLILLVLALAQFGCGYQYGDVYEVESFGDPLRQRLERESGTSSKLRT